MASDIAARIRSHIRRYEYVAAEACLRITSDDPIGELLRAEILVAQGKDPRVSMGDRKCFARKALRCLIECFLSSHSLGLSREDRSALLEALIWASSEADQDLSGVLGECTPTRVSQGSDELVKAFYFGRALRGHSAGEEALTAKKRLIDTWQPRDTLGLASHSIEFLKMFSSYTPLLAGADPARLGGGYFASFGAYGCIIDPGHHFRVQVSFYVLVHAEQRSRL